jgi:hypothetical protein
MSDAPGCANCGRPVDGPAQKFCPACGQTTPVHRIDWHFMLHELEHSVLHMDRGILYSLKGLMLRPGRLIRDYLEGRRANQVKPFLLVMITAAVVLFLAKILLGGDLIGSSMQVGFDAASGGKAGEGFDPAQAFAIFDAVKVWVNTHFVAFTLLLLPAEAAVFWLAFKGRGLNYPEWLVVSAYLTAQAFVLMMAAVLVQRWLPNAQMWASLLAAFYGVFSLVQLFPHHGRWGSTMRAILGLVMYMLAQSSITVAIAIAVHLVLMRG